MNVNELAKLTEAGKLFRILIILYAVKLTTSARIASGYVNTYQSFNAHMQCLMAILPLSFFFSISMHLFGTGLNFPCHPQHNPTRSSSVDTSVLQLQTSYRVNQKVVEELSKFFDRVGSFASNKPILC